MIQHRLLSILRSLTLRASTAAFLACLSLPNKAYAFSEVGSLTLHPGAQTFSTVLVDGAGEYAYLGTRTQPASILKVRLSDDSRAGLVTLPLNENYITTGFLDPDGQHGYFAATRCPAGGPYYMDLEKITLSNMSVAATLSVPITTCDGYAQASVVDPIRGFAYIAPGKDNPAIVKIRLSNFTVADTLTPSQNASVFYTMEIDPAAGYAYLAQLGTGLMKLDLAQFKITGILPLDSSDGRPQVSVIDIPHQLEYLWTANKLIKVSLGNLSRVASADLPKTAAFSGSVAAVIDSAGRYAYEGVSEGNNSLVNRVDLHSLTVTDSLNFPWSTTYLSAATTNPQKTVGYFVNEWSPGHLLKLDLASFRLTDDFVVPAGENSVSAIRIDPAGTFGYIVTRGEYADSGSQAQPSVIVKFRISDFSRVGALTLQGADGRVTSASMDPAGQYLYLGTFATAGKVIRIRLSDFQRVDSLTLTQPDSQWSVMDPAGRYAYFGGRGFPAGITKVDLQTFSVAATLALTGNDVMQGFVIDPGGHYIYASCGKFTSTTFVRVRLDTFQVDATTTLGPASYNLSTTIDPTGAFAYSAINYGNRDALIQKINLATMQVVGAINLPDSSGGVSASVVDPQGKYVYFAENYYRRRIFKLNTGDLGLVSTIVLQDGEVGVSAAAMESSGRNAYFGTGTSPGIVVKIDLADAAGTNTPPAPSGLSAVPGDQSVTLAWDAVRGASGYAVYWGTQPGVVKDSGHRLSTGATVLTATHSGLSNGTPYYYRVASINASGESDLSIEVSATPSAVPAASLQFETDTLFARQTDGQASIRVVRSGGLTSAVTVHYGTSDGTALAGRDYTTASGTLNFGSGDAAKTFSIPIVSHGSYVGDRNLSVTLSAPGVGAFLGQPSVADLTILDDTRVPQPGTFAFSTGTYFANQDDASTTIVINRLGGSDGAATVDFVFQTGTAVPGVDYVAPPDRQTLHFASGETSKTLTITLKDSGQKGVTKTLSWILDTPTAGTVLAAPPQTYLMIANVHSRADLSVQKTYTNSLPSFPLQPGSSIRYRITVTNNGPDTASSVVMTDVLPSSTLLFPQAWGAQGGLCNPPVQGVLTCTASSLAAGRSSTFTVLAVVRARGVILNTASATSQTRDPDLSNNTGSVSFIVGSADAPIYTSVGVSPASVSLAANRTQQFTAVAKDQFGAAMARQPTFQWYASGGGTIDAAGLFTAGTQSGGPFTITALDPSLNGLSGTASVTITGGTSLPVITSGLSASGTMNVAFSYQVTASNSPTSFDATGLPAGLSINTATGLISGTPTSAGTTNVTISATNAGGRGSAILALTITSPGAPVITSAAQQTGTVNVAFTYQITGTNSPTTFSATGLPTGLSVDGATGLISGTPTVPGNFFVSLGATNATGTGNLTLALTINPPAPVITSDISAGGVVGTVFNYQITASNSPTAFSASGLPAGLSINTVTGLISGTPTVAGPSTVTISATNITGTGSAQLAITILPAAPIITSASSATGDEGSTFSYQITATNSPTSFDATDLPDGLSIDTVTGLISGTPTESGPSTVALSATNATGTGFATLILTIAAPNDPPTVSAPASASPNPVRGTTTMLSVFGADDGGEPDLTYQWEAITKPVGAIVLFDGNGTNADQQDRVTFDTLGSYLFRVTITDRGGKSVTSTISVTVVPTIGSLVLDPSNVHLESGQTQTFSVRALDQFGNTYDSADLSGVIWSVESGPGSVNNGLYTAGDQAAVVKAILGSAVGHATINSQAALSAPTLLGFINLKAQMNFGDSIDLNVAGGAADTFVWTFNTGGTASQSVGSISRSEQASIRTQSPRLSLRSLASSLALGPCTVTVTASNRAGTAALSGNFELIADSLDHARVYPNPYRVDKYSSNTITFDHITPQSTVRIFSIDGKHIKTLDALDGSARWDLADSSGHSVASGIYLYVINNQAGQKARGKLAVIR